MEPNSTNNEPEMVYPDQHTGPDSKKSTRLIVLLIVVAIVVAGAGIFFVLRDHGLLPMIPNSTEQEPVVNDASDETITNTNEDTTTSPLPVDSGEVVTEEQFKAAEEATQADIENIQEAVNAGALNIEEGKRKVEEAAKALPPPPPPPPPAN